MEPEKPQNKVSNEVLITKSHFRSYDYHYNKVTDIILEFLSSTEGKWIVKVEYLHATSSEAFLLMAVPMMLLAMHWYIPLSISFLL